MPLERPVALGADRRLKAVTLDISETGLRCRVEEELEESSEVTLSFTIDEEEDQVELPVSAVGHVARCRGGEEGYDVGIEFYGLDEEAKRRLAAIVNKSRG